LINRECVREIDRAKERHAEPESDREHRVCERERCLRDMRERYTEI